jgi:hypothetical protein
MKPTSSAERTLTFAPDMNGRHDPEAKRLLLLVARKAKIPQISIGTFSRHFGSIVDEANQIRITTRRISSNDINLAFDRITKSVQQLHSRLLALESCTDFNSAEYFVARQLRATISVTEAPRRPGVQDFLQVLDELTFLLDRSKKTTAQVTRKAGHPTGGSLAFDTYIAGLWLAVRSNGGKLTIYKSPEGLWAGSAVDIVNLLRPYLPKRNFVPGNLGSSLKRIIGRWTHGTDSSQPGKFIRKSTARKSTKKPTQHRRGTRRRIRGSGGAARRCDAGRGRPVLQHAARPDRRFRGTGATSGYLSLSRICRRGGSSELRYKPKRRLSAGRPLHS